MAEESFDIYDERMNPLGIATRREAHEKGYWHRTFHCWLARRTADSHLVLFQRRQLWKDTNPGCYDITAAGHLLAGEGMQEAVRELEEELGVSASFEELIPLSQVREEAEGIVNGKPFIDREVSDVFGLSTTVPLESFRLQHEEVAGIYEAEIEAMLSLFRGERTSLNARGVELAELLDGSELLDERGKFKAESDNFDSATDEEAATLAYCAVERIITAGQFVPRERSYYIDILSKLQACT